MNQNDQMRTTVDRLLGEIVCLEGAVLYKDPWPELELRVRDMKKIAEQALNHTPDTGKMVHVNETPKNEHDSDDVLKPAKLVLLTADEIEHEYSKADAYLMLCDEYEFGLFAKALQDALIKKNGG